MCAVPAAPAGIQRAEVAWMSGGGAHAVGDRGGRGVHGTYARNWHRSTADLNSVSVVKRLEPRR
jgi:hypothetical protein